jgi:hypothetical protein
MNRVHKLISLPANLLLAKLLASYFLHHSQEKQNTLKNKEKIVHV